MDGNDGGDDGDGDNVMMVHSVIYGSASWW